MSYFEYHVVPAPKAAPRKKGVKGTEARFAANLADVMNAQAAEGWEFHRAETLPCEARKGVLSGKTVETHSVLVFRRWVELEAEHAPVFDSARTPEALAADLEKSAPPVTTPPVGAPLTAAPEAPRATPELGGARKSPFDGDGLAKPDRTPR